MRGLIQITLSPCFLWKSGNDKISGRKNCFSVLQTDLYFLFLSRDLTVVPVGTTVGWGIRVSMFLFLSKEDNLSVPVVK